MKSKEKFKLKKSQSIPTCVIIKRMRHEWNKRARVRVNETQKERRKQKLSDSKRIFNTKFKLSTPITQRENQMPLRTRVCDNAEGVWPYFLGIQNIPTDKISPQGNERDIHR